MLKRVHVYYSGMVQGVGFRFTVKEAARSSGINGWVRNLRDGKVEIMAEAEEASLNEFLNTIKQDMENYIHNIDLGWLEPTGEFSNFSIAF